MLNSASPPPAADSATDLRYPGRVTVTVSPTGSFSGALEYQGTSYALLGAFDPVTYACSISIQRASLPSINFMLQLTESDMENGSVSASATELLRTTNSTRVAWLEQSQASPVSIKSAATLKKAVGAASSVVGKTFSCVFKGSSASGAMPGGYGLFTVSSTGMVSLVGRLGEGTDASTSLSNSTHLSSGEHAAVYRSLYGIGQLAGIIRLRLVDPNDTENNAVQTPEGDLEWKNPGIVSSVTITFPGSGYTLIPGLVISGGSGTGVQGVSLMAGGRVLAVNLSNPGYGYASPPDVRIPKSAAQPFNSSFREAKALATILPAFNRKLSTFGSLYTAPVSESAMTAAQMLGTTSETTLSFRAIQNAGDVFLPVLPSGIWGVRNASIVKPTTSSFTAAWNTSGGSQESGASATISGITITPTASSPLRTISFTSTAVNGGSLTVTVPLSVGGVVIQGSISSGGVVLPRGIYGVISRDNVNWNEWCIR
jgi:hypothetical protein